MRARTLMRWGGTIMFVPTMIRARCARHASLLVVVALTVLVATAAHAEQKLDDPEWSSTVDNCDLSVGSEGSIYQNGLGLLGETIQIVGDLFKVSYVFGPDCPKVTQTGLPFVWNMLAPPASLATLQGADPSDEDPLNPFFVPDVVGTYVVTLTYCPASCPDKPTPGQTIEPQFRSIDIEVAEEIVVPASSVPELPPSAKVPAPFFTGHGDEKCLTRDEANVAFPQWVTTDHWDGAEDYGWIEGKVLRSRIAGKDGEVNHTTHDFDFKVVLDPARRGVSKGIAMGVEWETGSYLEAMRPLPGDRVSAYGFHIFDCDHEIADDPETEIHPPVVTAVQRPRPISIPVSEGYGSNVYVPGIVTDIWANRSAGEITSNCSWSGLHQPGHYEFGIFPNPGDCIESPHPVDRTFRFNVYLPPNPARLMAETGRHAEPAPLYCVVGNQSCADGTPPGFSPAVSVENETDPATGSDITYLVVTIGPTDLQGPTYSPPRITAGWVYPSPEGTADNWGLARYGLRINSLEIVDDQDAGIDPGDWELWVAINNMDKMWSRLLEAGFPNVFDGLTLDFGGRPWETESTEDDRTLGSHLLLFPDDDPLAISSDLSRRGYLHASGYDDEFWSDDIGYLHDIFFPALTPLGGGSVHHYVSASSIGAYVLDYTVTPLGSVGPAVLNDVGRELSERFTVHPEETGRCTEVRPGVCVLLPGTGDLTLPWHPLDVRLSPGDPPLVWYAQPLFKFQLWERHSDISMKDLLAQLESARENNPEWAEGLVVEMREEFDLVHGTPIESDFQRALPPLELGIPPDFWLEHFGDIDPTPPNTPPMVAVTGGTCQSDKSASAEVRLGVADVETSAGDLAVTATSSNPALIPNGNLALGGSGADRTLTLSGVPKGSGSATITISVSDGVDSATLDVAVQIGTSKTEVLSGTTGPDVLFGLAGKNTLNGGEGNDLLCGGNASDTLNGGMGNDVLQGGNGNDLLAGGDGNDSLLGENGDDTLTGGVGADAFSGGAGTDVKTDFNPAQGDTTDGT